MIRRPLNPKKRFQILNRDNFTCQYCGLKAGQGVQLQVDHKIPVSKGGDNSLNNLITSCFECNIGKGSEDKKELKELLYKTKIGDNIKKHITYFIQFWNYKEFGNIDNNTMALLKILYSNQLGGENYLTMIDYPYYQEYKKHFKGDIQELDNRFKTDDIYCNKVLLSMDSPFGHYLNLTFEETEILSDEIENNEIWKGECETNMNNRLNYILSEKLYDLYIDGELKNDFSIKKFSYFYNQIKNG